MRISENRIEELKRILKTHYNLDYDNEQAQQAGRSILKFVGLKIYQQSTKEVKNEQRRNSSNIRNRKNT